MTATKDGSKVVISVSGAGLGTVFVDGTEVKGVRSVATAVNAGEPPSVVLSLGIRDGAQIEYEGATISIADVEMPVAVELALWQHLAEKYGRVLGVTTPPSTSAEKSLHEGFFEGVTAGPGYWKTCSEHEARNLK